MDCLVFNLIWKCRFFSYILCYILITSNTFWWLFLFFPWTNRFNYNDFYSALIVRREWIEMKPGNLRLVHYSVCLIVNENKSMHLSTALQTIQRHTIQSYSSFFTLRWASYWSRLCFIYVIRLIHIQMACYRSIYRTQSI